MLPGIDFGLREEHGYTRWIRPGRPLFDPRGHEVARCPERDAKRLVELHHYSHSWPSALRCYALYHGVFMVGCVCISYPMNEATLPNWFPDLEPKDESAEIGRVLLLPGAAFNAATWMLSRVFELERQRGTLGLLAFSDPMPRTTLDDRVVHRGHRGVTYMGLLGALCGRSRPRDLLIAPDTTSIPDRSFQKVIGYERGWQGMARRLVRAGFPPPPDGDRHDWGKATRKLLRTLKHKGNLRYLFALDPIVGLPQSPDEYPKELDVMEKIEVP
jgi:hypothetical protein